MTPTSGSENPRMASILLPPSILAAGLIGLSLTGCLSPTAYRRQADQVAGDIIEEKQLEALGHTEPFTIEPARDTMRRRLLLDQELPSRNPASFGTDRVPPIERWPEDPEPPSEAAQGPWIGGDEAFSMNLETCLQVGARNSREYQDRKENVFRAALDLDLERDQFRNTYFGMLDTIFSTNLGGDDSVNGVVNTDTATLTRRFKTGAALSSRIILDLVQLIRGDRSESLGIFADATVSIPLLRGSGRHIVTEPLKQAERNVVYSIQSFERFKRTFAVQIATEYLSVIQLSDQVANAEDNYRRLIFLARRSRRLGDAGRLPEVQVDQAKQDELRARDRWISAVASYQRRLDNFKVTLGLPTDSRITLERGELQRLSEVSRVSLGQMALDAEAVDADAPIELEAPTLEDGGPLEIEEARAILLAFENRQDLRTVEGQVFDTQRRVVVAADALRAGMNLVASGQFGERRGISTAGLSNSELRPEKGFYSAALELDLPFERTAERNIYRNSLIDFERATRAFQELEDQVKRDVRDGLRNLRQAGESYRIQDRATVLAQRRVDSTNLLLDAGRAQIRDLLEAQEALISAQNSLTAALVNYRISELELQRDMGVLEVDERGIWKEYLPNEIEP